MVKSSIYLLSNKLSEEELKEEVEKRQNSRMSISLGNFWFSYDFSIMEMSIKISKNFNEINNKISSLKDYEREFLFRDMVLDELTASFSDRFRPISKKSLFNYWIYENGKGNSSLIDSYKTLISSSERTIKDIYDLKRLYDVLIKPRNTAYHLKNVKKYHFFRTEELIENDKSNLILSERGDKDEQEIIKSVTCCLQIINSQELDPYSKIGIFLFLFLKSMPFYNENFFIAKYVISSYLWNIEKNYSLALSIGSFLMPYKKLLASSYKETVSENNHGDLSHFVFSFLEILLDGSNRLLQELAVKESKKQNEFPFSKEKKNAKKIGEILISSSIYSEYGVSVYEMKKLSGISLPTINRFIAKYNQNIKKTRFIKRDYYSIK